MKRAKAAAKRKSKEVKKGARLCWLSKVARERDRERNNNRDR